MGYYTQHTLKVQKASDIPELKSNLVVKSKSVDEVLDNLVEKLKEDNTDSKKEMIIESLNMIESEVDIKDIIPLLRKQCEEAAYALDDDGESADHTKWYKHDEDMISFSKKYPQFVFILSGKGEENDDIWKSYYHNGKITSVKAEIVFKDPNWNDLV